MNLDIKCEGEITWQQGNMSSVIYFALCNQKIQTESKPMSL